MPIELGTLSIAVLTAGLLLMLLQVLVNQLLARTRDREDRRASLRNSACVTFQAAFNDILTDLCNIEESYSVAATLRRRFPDHQAAYVRFALRLTGQAKRDLDEAWQEYEKYHRQFEEQTIRLLGVDIPESEQRRIVLGHINRLLAFARET